MVNRKHSKVNSAAFNELSASLDRTNLTVPENTRDPKHHSPIFATVHNQPATPLHNGSFLSSTNSPIVSNRSQINPYSEASNMGQYQTAYHYNPGPQQFQQPPSLAPQPPIFKPPPPTQFETPQVLQYPAYQNTPQRPIYQTQPQQQQSQPQQQQSAHVPAPPQQYDQNSSTYYYQSYQQAAVPQPHIYPSAPAPPPTQHPISYHGTSSNFGHPFPTLNPDQKHIHLNQQAPFQRTGSMIYVAATSEKSSPLSNKYASPDMATSTSGPDHWTENNSFNPVSLTQSSLLKSPPGTHDSRLNRGEYGLRTQNRNLSMSTSHNTRLSSVGTTQKVQKPSSKGSKSIKPTPQTYKLSTLSLSFKDNTEINEQAKCEYLRYYASTVNLSKQLASLLPLLPEINDFQQYITNSELINHFTTCEHKFQESNEFLNLENSGEYRLEEFYKYVRDFPKSELVKFSDIFNKLSSLFNDWIKIKDSKEEDCLNFEHFFNNLMESVPKTDMDSDKLTSHYLKHSKGSSVPGESVSLQVVPLRENTGIPTEKTEFASQGILHPELSFKVKLICQHCGATKTPEWRKGPKDARTLCNACGLFHTKLVKKMGAEAAAAELKRRREEGDLTNRRV